MKKVAFFLFCLKKVMKMARGRKPKIQDEEMVTFVIEMSGFSTCLQDLADYVKVGCDVSVTLPTVRTLLINELGDDGYKELTKQWSTIRSKGHC